MTVSRVFDILTTFHVRKDMTTESRFKRGLSRSTCRKVYCWREQWAQGSLCMPWQHWDRVWACCPTSDDQLTGWMKFSVSCRVAQHAETVVKSYAALLHAPSGRGARLPHAAGPTHSTSHHYRVIFIYIYIYIIIQRGLRTHTLPAALQQEQCSLHLQSLLHKQHWKPINPEGWSSYGLPLPATPRSKAMSSVASTLTGAN